MVILDTAFDDLFKAACTLDEMANEADEMGKADLAYRLHKVRIEMVEVGDQFFEEVVNK